MAVGMTSFEDWHMFTWSLGWIAPSVSSLLARVAITSFAFIFVDVPEPVWQRSLNAIAGLVADEKRKDMESPTRRGRFSWELDTLYASINLEAVHQKRKGRTWSKGRKVALTRLYAEFKDAKDSESGLRALRQLVKLMK